MMVLKINPLTRMIDALPEGFVLVEMDNSSQILSFEIPKSVGGTPVDANRKIKIVFRSSMNTIGADVATNIGEEGENLTFNWEIKNTFTSTIGKGWFSVTTSDDTGFLWSTIPREVLIVAGIREPDGNS